MQRFLVLVLLALGLGGCALTPDSVDAPFDRRVTIAPDLVRDLVVTDVHCARGSAGMLSFQANVVNHTARDLGLEWRVVWLDADGLEVDSAVSTWRKLMVAPQDIAMLRNTANTSNAVDMRFYVRRLRR